MVPAELYRPSLSPGEAHGTLLQFVLHLPYGMAPLEDMIMAKGQKKTNREARKPKAEVKKTNAANPSTKTGVVRGLENFKN